MTGHAADTEQTAHRPWPMPAGPWAMRMAWSELLFAHWPVSPGALAPWLPRGLSLETHDGTAWLGVIPFRMSGVRPRACPPVPTASDFPELNVRTYVTDGRKPGVWFFSLDAHSRLAVAAARLAFHLNYRYARMRARREGKAVVYESRRASGEAELAGRYEPRGAPGAARPGSLEAFLTERYCLYAADRRGRLWRGEIHHRPWPLQPATASFERNTMADPLGIPLREAPAHLLYAERLNVVAWPPRRA